MALRDSTGLFIHCGVMINIGQVEQLLSYYQYMRPNTESMKFSTVFFTSQPESAGAKSASKRKRARAKVKGHGHDS